MGDSELQQLQKIGDSGGGRNPYQESRYQELLKSQPQQQQSSTQSFDPVANAQKLLDFQKTANAPVVSALQGQVPGIQDKYKQLVDSIKGNQQLDSNRQTLTTNNELGRRGISSDSGLYQQEMTNSLTPINTQYSGQLAQANAGSIGDTQNLALQIAQLQAGNPDSALSGALNLTGLQNSYSLGQQQNANQLALGQQQNANQLSAVNSQNALNQILGNYQNTLSNRISGANISNIANNAIQFGAYK